MFIVVACSTPVGSLSPSLFTRLISFDRFQGKWLYPI